MRISDWSSDVCSSDLDTLGHPVGDKLLAQVAARLKGLMERGMTCGRLGGDEFAVVLHNVPSAGDADSLAQRIIAAISRPYVVDNHQLFVGASIGSIGRASCRESECQYV